VGARHRRHPAAELADEAGAELYATDEEDLTVYGPDGFEVPEDRLAAAYEVATDALGAAAQGSIGLMEDASVGALVDLSLEDLEPDDEALVRQQLTWEVELDYATDLDQLSAVWHPEGVGYDGGDAVVVDGYLSVVEPLADGYPIRFRAAVAGIEWGDGVALAIQDRDEVVEADAVLLTIPLGALQNEPLDFDPPLPDEKQAAIDNLGMGTLDKVALRFPEVFWDEGDFIGFVNPEGGAFSTWLNLAPATGEPILVALTAGRTAAGLEELDDEAVVALAMDALRTIYES
jgi:hypothetical protein